MDWTRLENICYILGGHKWDDSEINGKSCMVCGETHLLNGTDEESIDFWTDIFRSVKEDDLVAIMSEHTCD